MATRDTASAAAEALAERLRGDAYGPAHPAYDAGRAGFFDDADLRPAIVALPETAHDVVEVVGFAAEHGLRVAPQSTGHNAYPLDDLAGAILLRTRRMREVTVDPDRRVARAEAGAWSVEIAEAAAAHGLAMLAGSSPDVGVVGYTLGGGIGWLVRRHGLAVHQVAAIEVVTPDGRLVHADDEHEPDLFWALRGGGGAFGVVTAIELRLVALREAYAGILFFGADRAAEVMRAWRAWTRTAPEEATSLARVLNMPDIPDVPEPLRGRSFALVEAAYAGDPEAGAEAIAPLRALGPDTDTFAPMSPVELCRLHMDPEGTVPGTAADHLLVGDGLDDAAIDALAAVAATGPGSPLVAYELRHLGGAAARPGDGHGAIDRVPAEFSAFGFGIAPTPEAHAAIEADLERIRDALAPHAVDRLLLGFTERRAAPERFFDAAACARLAAIRERVDPGRLLVANHPVG